jgi:hypothetical protein
MAATIAAALAVVVLATLWARMSGQDWEAQRPHDEVPVHHED